MNMRCLIMMSFQSRDCCFVTLHKLKLGHPSGKARIFEIMKFIELSFY